MTFSTDNIPPLNGKVVLITGASSGIGKATTLELARKGAHVFLACRNENKTRAVIQEIVAETGNANLEYIHIDLANLRTVKACADNFLARRLPLHVLINNGGVMMIPEFTKTVDGFETQWGVNYLSHFYLTTLLLPVLESSAPSRIVNVSSLLHKATIESWFHLENLNNPAKYSSLGAYATSKASMILFSLQLDKILKNKGISNVFVNSLHPGSVNTSIVRNMSWIIRSLAVLISPLILMTPAQGALTSLYVATSADIEFKNYRAQYFVPYGDLSSASSLCQNEKVAEELWKYSEKAIEDMVEPKMRAYSQRSSAPVVV